MSPAAAVHHCTCPQAIRAENHKAMTAKWWKDPRWRPLSDAFLKDNPVCEYCGKKSALVHHDNAKSYRSQEEYYKPENFTAACLRCHHAYRTGYVICPVCREHYMKRDAEQCRACTGLKYPKLQGRKQPYNYRAKQRHPCAHRVGQQRCQRDGRLFVCGRSSKNASGCEHFEERVRA
jgi:hypothetical protein